MSDFLNEISNKITDSVTKIGDNSKNLLEKSKLSASIYAYSSERKQSIQELGEAYYECYLNNCEDAEKLNELCVKISKLDEQIDVLKRAKDLIQGNEGLRETRAVICSCGYSNKLGDIFCANCGSRLGE